MAEQLQVYSKNLKEKKNQMKAMKEELEMYKSQVDEYKYSLEKMDDKFVDLQDEYFEVMESRQKANRGSKYVDEGDDLNGNSVDADGFLIADSQDNPNVGEKYSAEDSFQDEKTDN